MVATITKGVPLTEAYWGKAGEYQLVDVSIANVDGGAAGNDVNASDIGVKAIVGGVAVQDLTNAGVGVSDATFALTFAASGSKVTVTHSVAAVSVRDAKLCLWVLL